ncbi:MAG: NlpC/P60 family protein [Nitrosomonas sp.]|nr:MAG: NlpC/P60 family protein [Nitrosomonas sp.]
MKKIITHFSIFIFVGFLVSCGSIQEKPFVKSYPKPAKSSSYNINALYSQYHEWQGVRYQKGGLSSRGIDCSGFVHVTFKSKFGIDLPRTTHMQARFGREIQRDELMAGDLVFFRTGPTSSHVGIYLEKNKFIHASEKNGIMISRLDHVYWQSNYWKSVRI